MSKFVKNVNIVKMLVRSCFLITLIKCLKGHKSLGSLCNVKSKSEWLSQWVTQSVTRSPIELLWTAKNIIIFWNLVSWFNVDSISGASATAVKAKKGTLGMSTDTQMRLFKSSYDEDAGVSSCSSFSTFWYPRHPNFHLKRLLLVWSFCCLSPTPFIASSMFGYTHSTSVRWERFAFISSRKFLSN